MTEYQNTVINPAAPWSFIHDTEENILHDLEHYTLDPVFEFYGNFINPSPKWLSEEIAARYAGCTSIFGNFLTLSHAFRLVTNDAGLISRLSTAIARNKATPEYQAARRRMLDKLPALTKQTAHAGRVYVWPGGWLKLTRVYRLTEQEANNNALLYLDRWEGIDHNGMTRSAAFHDGDQLPTTENWKLWRRSGELKGDHPMTILYEKFKKYQAPASSVEDFRRCYTKPDRFAQRDPEYQSAVLQSARDDLAQFGYTIISRYDSVTGEVVAYYGKEGG